MGVGLRRLIVCYWDTTGEQRMGSFPFLRRDQLR